MPVCKHSTMYAQDKAGAIEMCPQGIDNYRRQAKEN